METRKFLFLRIRCWCYERKQAYNISSFNEDGSMTDMGNEASISGSNYSGNSGKGSGNGTVSNVVLHERQSDHSLHLVNGAEQETPMVPIILRTVSCWSRQQTVKKCCCKEFDNVITNGTWKAGGTAAHAPFYPTQHTLPGYPIPKGLFKYFGYS